ncbi:MAG: ATP-binding protein, partial [Gaiellales bacterium]
MSSSVAERVRERAGALGLVAGTPVVAMLSGGADSTLLVVTLAELGCAVRVVHVAHGLRGIASQEDADACGELAAHVVARAVDQRAHPLPVARRQRRESTRRARRGEA